MKKLTTISYTLLALLLPLLLISGCKNKELCIPGPGDKFAKVIVKINWKNFEGKEGFVKPQSMRLYIYREDGRLFNDTPLEIYQQEGQEVEVPVGHFAYYTINNNSNCINDAFVQDFEPESSVRKLQTYKLTSERTELRVRAFKTKSAPKLREYDKDDVLVPPVPTFVCLDRNIVIKDLPAGTQVVELTPVDPLTHYTVIAYDVKNAHYYSSADPAMEGAITAALYGIANGWMLDAWKPAKEFGVIQHTYVVKPDPNGKQPNSHLLEAHFLGYGSPEGFPKKHTLQFFVATSGVKRMYSVDVSDQVVNAPNPRDVLIEIRGMELEPPIANGHGFDAEVDPWKDEEVIPIEL